MDISEQAPFGRLRRDMRLCSWVLSAALVLAAGPRSLFAQAPPMPTYVPESAVELQQLVAPIALYPDSLVAEILAASTYPEQVVEADRWLQAQGGLTGEALAQAVDQQPWDASVKALTAFPPVLGNMDRNLSWTSSLGDAYYNQPQDVMAAVQVMRQRAQAAGNLLSTPQQAVAEQGPDIEIDPVSADVIYVPAYDPWSVYGAPLLPWPGWYAYPGIWFAGPYLSFGVGIPVGFLAGFAWGWPHWGCNWNGRFVSFGGGRYVSRSVTFFNRGEFYRGFGARGPSGGRSVGGEPFGGRAGAMPRPFNGDDRAARGYAEPRGQAGMRSGAFSDYTHGGDTRGFEARGRASFGGGAFGGGGGFRGGGGFGGGGGRR